jgi:putative peptidoglycan lipid II flippase
MEKSVYRSVTIASLIMMASVFLSRVIGLFREMVIAGVGGTHAAVDAYQVAFVIPEILNHIVASGFLSITFIPIFTGYLTGRREAEGWRLFSVILTLFGGALALLILGAWFLAAPLLSLSAPGFRESPLFPQAVEMMRIILPAQFFFFCGGLFMAVQFAKGSFAIPALAPLVYNLGIIAGGLVGGSQNNMIGFAWGVLGGAFAGSFLLQLVGAARAGMRYRPVLDFRHPDLKKYILVTIPLMVGLTMTFSTEIFFRFFGSYLPDGSIAGLNYALRIMFIVVGLVGQAVGVASYPFMAKLASEDRLAELNTLLNTLLRYLAITIPLSVVVIILRHEVVLVLFQRGAFTPESTALTARALAFIMVGAFAFSAQTVVARGFYAMQNTLLPAVYGTAAVVLSLPLYIIGMQWMGVNGVALACALSATLQVVVLYAVWNWKRGNQESRDVYRAIFKILGLSVFLGGFAFTLRAALMSVADNATFSGCLVILAITGGLSLFFLVVAGYFLRIEEITSVLQKIARKVKRE